MTLMMVVVRSAEEAAAALAGGADRLVLRQSCGVDAAARIGQARGRGPVALWVDDPSSTWLPLATACGADVVIGPAALLDEGGLPVGIVPWLTAPAQRSWVWPGGGVGGIVLGLGTSPAPLLEPPDPTVLAPAIAAARRQGLLVVVGGRLEPPDVPRILALAPDGLLVDDLVRHDGPQGPLDGDRLRLARDLIAQDAAPFGGPIEALGPDRIAVRDWTVAMEIGAYRHEQAPQRVSFTVEAELAPARGSAADMRDVVSYDLITDAIARAGATRVALVETLAEDVARAVLGHPRVLMVDVAVEKLDLGPGRVGCRLRRRRA